MAKSTYLSDNNDTLINQLAATMEELVEQSDILLEKMKNIKERDEELQEKENINSPKCEEFLGSKYEDFKNSRVIDIEDIKEFISAKNELDNIKEERMKLEKEAGEINKRRSILTTQVEEAYEKIVSLIKSSNEVSNENHGIYVSGLKNSVDIIDTYIRKDREKVDTSVTEIIRTAPKICDTLYQDYSENITKIESEPIENYSETQSLIGSLNELIRIQNINIDSQIPLLNKSNENNNNVLSNDLPIKEDKTELSLNEQILPQPEKIEENKTELSLDEQILSQPEKIEENKTELSLDEQILPQPEKIEEKKQEQLNVEKPVLEATNNIINLDSIIKETEKVENKVESDNNKSSETKVITIDVPHNLDMSNKIANSNMKKITNIENNFKKIAPFIVLDAIVKPELSVSNAQVDTQTEQSNVALPSEDNKVDANTTTDPIANFLNPAA